MNPLLDATVGSSHTGVVKQMNEDTAVTKNINTENMNMISAPELYFDS